MTQGRVTARVENVTFPSDGVAGVAGLLWTAAVSREVGDGRHRPAVVLSTPGSSVKEQIGANYASRLAEHGVTALTFDPSFQGQSGGEPRDLEDPAHRVADLSAALDFMTTLDFVDPGRLGLVGICAGGGYAVTAAMIDHRVRAVGTVVAVNIGRAFRDAHAVPTSGVIDLLDTVAQQRSAEARAADLRRDPWLPDTFEQARAAGISDPDVLDAIDFYRTPRGQDPHSTNRMLFRSNAALLGYDAFHLIEELLTQPVQAIVAGRRGSTGSFDDGVELTRRAAHSRALAVIDGAGHYDLYDKPRFVDPAVETLAAFFDDTL